MSTFPSDTRTHAAAGDATRNEREYLRPAEGLAECPSLVARLPRDHGEVGICSGGTMPGGRNVIMAPCPLRSVAPLAQTHVKQRVAR